MRKEIHLKKLHSKKSVQTSKVHMLMITGMIVLIFAAVNLFYSRSVYAENEYVSKISENEKINEGIIKEQIKSGNIGDIRESLKGFQDADFYELLPDFNPDKIIEDAAKGKFDPGLSGLFQRVAKFLFKEIFLNINIMIKLLVLAILCAILKNLKTSFLSDSVGELGFFVCYLVIVAILIVSFETVINMGRETIDSMVAFMHATIPVLMTLLVSSGNIVSGGVFQPVLILAVEVVATFLKSIFIPLIFFSATLSIVNNISNKFQITKLVGLLKSISFWMLATVLTVFVAILGVQGSMGAVVDGVTSKTAKLAIGVIPVAGKYLADAAEAVVSCALLIKNAAGIAVMVGIVSICLVPVLKIIAIIVIYRFAGALVEPISEGRITNCINDMAGSLSYIMAIIVSVAVMFLISITAIISAGNVTAMIR